jgi:hypothetical protein
VTADVTLTIDDPTLGSFERNVFTSVSSFPPFGCTGGIDIAFGIVRADDGAGSTGLADLALAEMRVSGDHRDVLFRAPYLAPTVPDHQTLAFLMPTGATTTDVTVVISNDPCNGSGPDGKPLRAAAVIADVRALDGGEPSSGCAPHAAVDAGGSGFPNTFTAVAAGDRVCFQIDGAINNDLPSRTHPISAIAYVDVVAMPSAKSLDRRYALMIVPAAKP